MSLQVCLHVHGYKIAQRLLALNFNCYVMSVSLLASEYEELVCSAATKSLALT
jgi:hypothetical protein